MKRSFEHSHQCRYCGTIENSGTSFNKTFRDSVLKWKLRLKFLMNTVAVQKHELESPLEWNNVELKTMFFVKNYKARNSKELNYGEWLMCTKEVERRMKREKRHVFVSAPEIKTVTQNIGPQVSSSPLPLWRQVSVSSLLQNVTCSWPWKTGLSCSRVNIRASPEEEVFSFLKGQHL